MRAAVMLVVLVACGRDEQTRTLEKRIKQLESRVEMLSELDEINAKSLHEHGLVLMKEGLTGPAIALRWWCTYEHGCARTKGDCTDCEQQRIAWCADGRCFSHPKRCEEVTGGLCMGVE